MMQNLRVHSIPVERLALALRVRPQRRWDEVLPIMQRWAERWARRHEPNTVLGHVWAPRQLTDDAIVAANSDPSQVHPATLRLRRLLAQVEAEAGSARRDRRRAYRRRLTELGPTATLLMAPIRVYVTAYALRNVHPAHRATVAAQRVFWDTTHQVPVFRFAELPPPPTVGRAP